MTNFPCSGCGLHSCDGRCFLECSADYADEPGRCRCGEILDDGECRVCDRVMRDLRATMEMQKKRRAA